MNGEPSHDRSRDWAVILAGGDGTRLQEFSFTVSGDRRPKQFSTFFGGKSLLAHTRERISPLFDEQNTLFAAKEFPDRILIVGAPAIYPEVEYGCFNPAP
jgi:mannose-1-phosphate guanylyltransferase